MSATSLYIAYDGTDLKTHEMDVKVLAPALLAFSDIFEEANTILNGDRAKAHVNMRWSFKTGSFGFELSVTQPLLQSILDLGKSTVTSAAALLKILGFTASAVTKGLINVLKWIGGRKIEKVSVDRKNVTLYIDKEHIEIEAQVFTLLQNERIRKAIDDAIAKPLTCDCIDTVCFTDSQPDPARIIIIEKQEANSFRSNPFNPKKTGTSDYEINLKISSVIFQENNKCRFSYGSNTNFYANITDEDFLRRIDNGLEVFDQGDEIKARIHERFTTNSNG
ncbi:MAG: hypothetical protein IJU79_07555, partial [Desulfovibrionaceae bacterium]|nr:hypothetical protein [Desulfovibrionaceae bacterium]